MLAEGSVHFWELQSDILTFQRGCPLALARLIRAGIIVLVITIDLGAISIGVVRHARATYDATSRAGTTLGDG